MISIGYKISKTKKAAKKKNVIDKSKKKIGKVTEKKKTIRNRNVFSFQPLKQSYFDYTFYDKIKHFQNMKMGSFLSNSVNLIYNSN